MKKKKRMLDFFKTTLQGGSQNNYFRSYATLWANDIGEPCTTDGDFEELWDLLDHLASFNGKLENPKAMRWFSVNGSCTGHLPELWPLKMIISYDRLNEIMPDQLYVNPAAAAHTNPREELRQLRALSGGWALAQELITPWLHTNIRVYQHASKALRLHSRLCLHMCVYGLLC